MKKTLIIFSVLALACGCGQKQTEEQQAVEIVPRVRVQRAELQLVNQDQVLSSTVQASAINNIAPQSAGRIKSIKTEIGSFVTKGQVLATMDDLQLAQSDIKLANDTAEYERLKSLLEKGGISQSDFDQVEMALKVSKSTNENLRQNTYLTSPINGVVTARNYDQGDMYVMGQPLFTVQQIVPVKLLVPVSEADYTKVKPGDKVSVSVDALPGKTYEGKIAMIHPTMDARSHTFNAEVHVQNRNYDLRPGMFARVDVTMGANSSIVIPDAAVVKQQGSGVRVVYVLKGDNTVRQKSVTLGRHIGDKYEILTGLGEGEQVVVRGAFTLREGQKVEVIEED
ncbi:MAG: efflux RND transporter periplasmic adaptor subunit [Bacteroidales bacterium]|nr:efflux RND transporter periplasmic adaptor subunit [Bacteroidales bacterium]